jgi:hypothetical protein
MFGEEFRLVWNRNSTIAKNNFVRDGHASVRVALGCAHVIAHAQCAGSKSRRGEDSMWFADEQIWSSAVACETIVDLQLLTVCLVALLGAGGQKTLINYSSLWRRALLAPPLAHIKADAKKLTPTGIAASRNRSHIAVVA